MQVPEFKNEAKIILKIDVILLRYSYYAMVLWSACWTANRELRGSNPVQDRNLVADFCPTYCTPPIAKSAILISLTGVTGQNIPPAGVYPDILWPRPIYTSRYILA